MNLTLPNTFDIPKLIEVVMLFSKQTSNCFQ